MANKLKIYACSGIGNAGADYNYWTDNTNTLNNTQAVNTMLTKINLAYAEAQYLPISEAETIKLLNTIDLYTLALVCADSYAGQTDKLAQCGRVIGKMYAEGAFENSSLDNSSRDKYLDELIDRANNMIEGNVDAQASEAFNQWWQENVMQRDFVGLQADERARIKKALKREKNAVAGDLSQTEDLFNKLNNGAEYFLYLFLSDTQIDGIANATKRKTIKTKRKLQAQTYEYCKGLYIKMCGSEKQMQEIIRTGIIQTFHDTPENLARTITEENPVGQISVAISIGFAEFIKILSIVAAVVVAVVAAICDTVTKSNTAKYAAVDRALVEASVPSEEDFPEGVGLSTTSSSKKGLLWLLGIGAAALLLLKR